MAAKPFKFAYLILAASFLISSVHGDGYFDFQTTLTSFDCTLVNIINFGNMDFGPLQFPTVLIRYFLKTNGEKYEILPIELRHRTTFPKNQTRSDLFTNLVPTEIASRSKQWFCQVHAFLGASEGNVQDYYVEEHGIVSPTSLQHFWNSKVLERDSEIISRKIYNILIFRQDEKLDHLALIGNWHLGLLTRKGNNGREYFVWRVGTNPTNSTIMNPIFTILDLFYVCPQCVPCFPYYVTPLETFPDNKAELENYLHGISKLESPKHWVILPNQKFYRFFYFGLSTLVVQLFQPTEEEFLFTKAFWRPVSNNAEWYIHVAFLKSLLPNTTFEGVTKPIENSGYEFQFLRSRSCAKDYEWKQIPILLHQTGSQTTYFPLRLPSNSLKILSCGKLTKSLFHPFVELFTAFDWRTWLAMLAMFVALSLLFSRVNRFTQKYLQERQLKSCDGWEKNFVYQFFLIFCCFLEQYPSHLEIQLIRVKCFAWVATIPLLFVILSNAYKGDNITRLTAPDQEIQMDTFDRLVEYNFTIYIMPDHLLLFDQDNFERQNESMNGIQVSDHEAYPQLSQLWKSIMLGFTPEIFSLKNAGNRLSNRTWFYLNNTRLIPNWEMSDMLYEVVIPYLQKCDRAAAIVDDNLAAYLYLMLLNAGKPANLGKDQFNYAQLGYGFYNWIPPQLLKRMKGLRDSGIVDWWEMFLSGEFVHALRQKALATKELNRGAQSTSFVIFVVWLFCNGIAVLVFVGFEVKRPVGYALRRMYKTIQPIRNLRFNLNNGVFVEVRSAVQK